MKILENLFEGAILASWGDWRVSYVNTQVREWLDRPPASICEIPLSSILALTAPCELATRLEHLERDTQQTLHATGRLQDGDKVALQVDVRMFPVDYDGKPHLAVLLRPSSVALNGGMHAASTAVPVKRRDPLTGLADRAFLISRLEQNIRRGLASNGGSALLFIDLDNFKQVNDAYGHLIGDRVLREVADRLGQCVRANDEVFRFGGDEFVVVVEGVAGADETKLVVDRIHAALAAPIALPDGDITLAVSIGVAMADATHRSAEDLLAEADRAMYASKRDGR